MPHGGEITDKIVEEHIESPFVEKADSGTGRDIGRESWEIYQDYEEDPRRRDWIDANDGYEEYYMGKQIDAKEADFLEARGMSDVVDNRIRPLIRHMISMLTSRIPSFNVVAVGGGADKKVSFVLKRIIGHILRKNKWGQISAKASAECLKDGVGVVHMFWDPMKDDGNGDIAIVSPRYSDVLPDSDCVLMDRQDSENMFLTVVKTLYDAQDAYPGFEKEIKERIDAHIKNYSDTNQLAGDKNKTDLGIYLNRDNEERISVPKVRIIERYTRKKITVYFIQDTKRGDVKEYYDKDEWKQRADELNAGEFTMYTKNLPRIIKITCVVDLEVDREVLPTSVYPFFFYVDEDTGNSYSQGEIGFLKGMQDVINKSIRIMILHASLASNPKTIMEEGAIDKNQREEWRDNYNQPGSNNFVKAGKLGQGKFILVNGSNMPNSFPQITADMKHEMEYQLGVFALAQGDPTDAPRTFKATLALKEYGAEKSKLLLRNIDDALTLAGQTIIEFIQYYYRDTKVFNLISDKVNHEDEEVTINVQPGNSMAGENGEIIKAVDKVLNDVTVGKYQAASVSQSYMPTLRQAQLEMMLQLKEAGVVDDVAVRKFVDVENIDEIDERMNAQALLQRQLEQMRDEFRKKETDNVRKDRIIYDLDRKILELKAMNDLDAKTNETNANIRSMVSVFRADMKKILDELKLEKSIVKKTAVADNGKKKTEEKE